MAELEPEIWSRLPTPALYPTWLCPSRYNRDGELVLLYPAKQSPNGRDRVLFNSVTVFFDCSAFGRSRAEKHGGSGLLCLSKAFEKADAPDHHAGHPTVKSLPVPHHPLKSPGLKDSVSQALWGNLPRRPLCLFLPLAFSLASCVAWGPVGHPHPGLLMRSFVMLRQQR